MQTQQVLQTLRLPARLTAEQAGSLLGFHPDSSAFLAKSGLLSLEPSGKLMMCS